MATQEPQGSNAKPSLIFLILANLIPVIMIFVANWSVGELLMAFWLENVVIGCYNVLRMLIAGGVDKDYPKLFIIPFFIFHYGMFTLGHGAILYELFFGNDPIISLSFGPNMVWEIVAGLNLWLPLIALTLSHGFSFYWNYLKRGEYRSSKVGTLMAQPYGRVAMMHITVLVGGFAAQALGSPVVVLLVLVVLKIWVDATFHLREHAKPVA